MANLPQNRIPIDAGADNSFVESPSFADLVCIQDQKPNSLSANANQNHKQDQNFKFTPATPNSTAYNLNKSSQDDMLIPNTQLRLQALLHQAKQSETKNQPCYKQNQKVRNQAKKERAATSSFGRKLFQSVVSPCRECHARQPTTKAHTMQQKKFKF
ncbi:hypothetical protein Pint_10532 [Pistacia integerrima]|uniref:Uncharacterized protein n=1 Tax=Pistacia integerrima TaxID=434235 RepID=A0ACC0XJN3_9ROSI|nr:hypothetical protein Pint_10532 [Pistacia integerrima]